MRQIKFRGKSIHTNKWVYGNLRIFGERAYISAIDSHAQSEVHLSTIGQFTGLTDSNGKKIYEGDILSTDLSKSYCEVVFRNGCFVLCLNDGEEDFYDILAPLEDSVAQTKYHAVIGNIHDNQPTEV